MIVLLWLDSISKRFNIFLTSVFTEQYAPKTLLNLDDQARLYMNCLHCHKEVTTQFLKVQSGLCFDDEHPTRQDSSSMPSSQQVIPERKNMGRELLMF